MAHYTQMAWMRLLMILAGYLTNDSNCDARCFCFFFPHGVVGPLFREIYNRSRTIRRMGQNHAQLRLTPTMVERKAFT